MKTRLSTPSKVLLPLSAAAFLAACGTTPLPGDQGTSSGAAGVAPVSTATPSTARSTGGAQPSATPQSSVATVNLGSGAAAGGAGTAAAGSAALMALPSQRVVYFDFDSFVIKDDFKPMLDGYARVLQANRGKKLMVEGHTDERGGREYNLALGQKRAAAVVNSLKLLGVNESQVEAVSFGEERPSAQGADESAWAKNRRAELKDR